MLSSLRIKNLAIVDELEVEFQPGLNVLTGETGAGKSIVLKAIELLTGRRAGADIIRSGTDRCIIEGIFLPSKTSLAAFAEHHDDFAELQETDEVLVRRVIDSSGRSKFSINGQLATAAIIQQLSQHLVDITGQHQQQFLLDSTHHLHLLDRFGVSNTLLASVTEAFGTYDHLRRRLEMMRKNRNQQEEYLERIRAEHQELLAAELSAGGRAQIEGELSKLANVETLTLNVNQALELLEQSDSSIDAQLRALLNILETSADLDPELTEIQALADSAGIQLREARMQLTKYGAALEADPAHLEKLREKVSELARLERKYSKSEEELIRRFTDLSRELEEMDGGNFDEASLEKNLQESEQKLRKFEGELHTARVAAAERLSGLVETGLEQLAMKRAKFQVAITAATSSALGADNVEFLLAANPGEPARALSKVASGGELSRILLVLKNILNEEHGPDTQVFDEIDVGVSGATSQIVGEKLHDVSKRCQVILVTHSPQVAAFADRHLFIEKSASDSHTTTQIRPLDNDERIKKLAAMLAGKKVSAPFEGSARELLAHGRGKREVGAV